MLPLESEANVFEIYIKPGVSAERHGYVKEFDVSLSEEQFSSLLKRMAKSQSKHQYKYFQKEYKEYVYNDIVVQNYKNTETRAFKNQTIAIEHAAGRLTLAHARSKLTFLSVPSTKNIHEVAYVKKLTFRVNNRIFVNFVSKIDEKTRETTRFAYVNYNHESNVDADGVEKTLEEVLALLG